MKKLIALLAVLGFVPCAYAADGAEFTHNGSFRLLYTNNMDADGVKDSGTGTDQKWEQRTRLGMDVRAGEKLSAHTTFVAASTWGAHDVVTQTPDTTNDLLIVNEAYATWMASDAWMIRFGQGALTMADGRFVSANEYEAVTKAFQGVLATWDQEMARISFFGVNGANDNVPVANTMANFFGLSADFKTLPSFLKAAHIHVVQNKVDAGTYPGGHNIGMGAGVLPHINENRIGFMVSGDMSGVDYRANYEMQSGDFEVTKGDKVKASMMDVEVGYSMAAMMNSRVHVGYHMDSGDDNAADTDHKTYNGFHYDTHENAGLMDIFGWGNLTYTRVGFSLEPADGITVAAEYLMFKKSEKADGVHNVEGYTNSFTTANASTNEDALGNEIDLSVTKKYTNNFNINARYGTFSPGDAFKNGGGNKDTYSQFVVAANLNF